MKRLRSNFALVLCVLMLSSTVFADTFIGNGGNSASMDLAITLSEIRGAHKRVTDYFDLEDICEADEGQERFAFFAVLTELKKEEVAYCKKFIGKQAAAFQKIAKLDGAIKFRWAPADIEVKRADGKLEKVQAVADQEEMTITIDETKFRELTATKRIALITHEMLHLMKIDGKIYGDNEPIGPFKSAGRFFTVLGASTAAIAENEGVLLAHDGINDTSRGYKRNWISYELIRSSIDEEEAELLLSSGAQSGGRFVVRRQIGKWGVHLGYGGLTANEKAETVSAAIEVLHSSEFFELGISRRSFPFDNPFSYWSQFHILYRAGVEYGSHAIKISDFYTTVEDDAKGYGLFGSVDAMFPIINGWWAHIGYGLRQHKYKFEKLDVTVGAKVSTQILVGVSYAFDY